MNELTKKIHVPVTLTLTPNGTGWDWMFGSDSGHLKHPKGDFDFTAAEQCSVVITLQNSDGVSFQPDEASIGFSRDEYIGKPGNPFPQIFGNIRVSGDGQRLSFDNDNPVGSGKFQYALFLQKAGEDIHIDPQIINK